MYFDGTGDYFSVADNAAFSFGSSDFTIEMWVRTTQSGYIAGISKWQTGQFSWLVRTDDTGTGKWEFFYSTTGTNYVQTSGVNIKDGAWHHLAVSRSGVNIRLFTDGVLSNTNTANPTIYTSTAPVVVGSDQGAQFFNGYISDIRIIKGTSVYTANFTPPTAPLIAVTNTSLLTLQNRQPPNNHTFQDSSSNNFLITRSGNATQGTFSPFSQSGWSVYFDGSTDCIKVPSDAAYGLGTGNFTIELFVYFEDYYSLQSRLAGQYVSGNTNGWQIFKNSNSYNLIFNTNSGDHFSYNWTTVKTGVWYHIAVVRSGTGANQTIMYVDGVNVASGTCAHSVGANQVVVGGLDWAANYSTKGYIASFR
ncbi:MAG: LamG domain-containing protein, partial [Chitinophagia bacterium]|nr:LamG domain-containing protein [Chitinophagia bacterium]